MSEHMRVGPHERLRGVYLDHQSTDRPRPAAVEAVTTFMNSLFGNSGATSNGRGQVSRRYLEQFRGAVADCVRGDPDGLVFTSGATEANNMVLYSESRRKNSHVVVSAFEHKCVLECAERAREFGARVSIAPVDGRGMVDLDAIRNYVSEGATLVSVMTANNEVGTVQPVREIARMCRREGVAFHTDAAQAIGKLELDFEELDADYLTFTAHKFGGPQGIGALLCKASLLDRLQPMLIGGGQERGLRSGTVPIALCAGFAAAATTATDQLADEVARMRQLRDRLLQGLMSVGPFFVNSDPVDGLCSNLNGGFTGIPALSLMRRMPEVHFSVGSACTTGAAESHVLKAMGLAANVMESSFRLSLGWATTEEDIDHALVAFKRAVGSLN
jgi:cysteine desulfurase